jgi:hypothetical protein
VFLGDRPGQLAYSTLVSHGGIPDSFSRDLGWVRNSPLTTKRGAA